MLISCKDPEGSRDAPTVQKYDDALSRYLTITDAMIQALVDFRKRAASDVAFWSESAGLGRFAKDEKKRAIREEKAATLWIKHFTEIGKKQSVRNFPAEMSFELDCALRSMLLAS